MSVLLSLWCCSVRQSGRTLCFSLLLTALIGSAQNQEITVHTLAERLPKALSADVYYGNAPRFADRAWWSAQATTPYAKQLIRTAERDLDSPLILPDDELYLDYTRTGNRDHYQAAYSTMQRAVARNALAYCFNADPRFKTRTLTALRKWLAMKSWLLPAHDHGNRTLKGKLETIELGSATLSWRLATLYRIWDQEIPEPERTQLREQLYRRTLLPFMEMLDAKRQIPWWIEGKSNWNAVCLAGTQEPSSPWRKMPKSA